jgi:hypothetical protein
LLNAIERGTKVILVPLHVEYCHPSRFSRGTVVEVCNNVIKVLYNKHPGMGYNTFAYFHQDSLIEKKGFPCWRLCVDNFLNKRHLETQNLSREVSQFFSDDTNLLHCNPIKLKVFKRAFIDLVVSTSKERGVVKTMNVKRLKQIYLKSEDYSTELCQKIKEERLCPKSKPSGLSCDICMQVATGTLDPEQYFS